jgi:thiazole synthase
VLPPENSPSCPTPPAATPPTTRCARCASARELLDGHALVKLEVLGDPQDLFPNMPETLKAAETLVKDGFEVMVYCADDPIQAKHAGGHRLRARSCRWPR